MKIDLLNIIIIIIIIVVVVVVVVVVDDKKKTQCFWVVCFKLKRMKI